MDFKLYHFPILCYFRHDQELGGIHGLEAGVLLGEHLPYGTIFRPNRATFSILGAAHTELARCSLNFCSPMIFSCPPYRRVSRPSPRHEGSRLAVARAGLEGPSGDEAVHIHHPLLPQPPHVVTIFRHACRFGHAGGGTDAPGPSLANPDAGSSRYQTTRRYRPKPS